MAKSKVAKSLKQGQTTTKQSPEQKNKSKMNGVKKTKQFKKEKGDKNINTKTIQKEVQASLTSPKTNQNLLPGALEVEVSIPKSLKAKSHEAVNKILFHSKELNCTVRSVTLKFYNPKYLRDAVQELRNLEIDGKHLILPDDASISEIAPNNSTSPSPKTAHKKERKEKKKPNLWRTFALPLDSTTDADSVKEYFDADLCRPLKLIRKSTKPRDNKVFQLKYASEEEANEAGKKSPMKVDNQEITLRDPALYHLLMQTTKSEGKKRMSSESTTPGKKGKFVETEKEDEEADIADDDEDEDEDDEEIDE